VTIDERPIAVFDSGLGGLTVVRQLRTCLPWYPLVYFGDTARVPYGTKSPEAVCRFTNEIVRFLLRFDPCCIVAACNTASAVALPQVSRGLDIPLIGVVLPGAREAAAVARDGDVVAVIATTATIASNAYRSALSGVNPRLAVVQKACPLFVPLVEEGRRPDDAIVRMAVREYLEPIRRLHPAVVVLACTHYPMLEPAIADFLGPGTRLIDSGAATARHVEEVLAGQSPAAGVARHLAGVAVSRGGTLRPESRGSGGGSVESERPGLGGAPERGRLLCYVSDNPQQFQAIGSGMLGEPITDIVRACPEEFAALPVVDRVTHRLAV